MAVISPTFKKDFCSELIKQNQQNIILLEFSIAAEEEKLQEIPEATPNRAKEVEQKEARVARHKSKIDEAMFNIHVLEKMIEGY